jgi:hypothetical protein
LAVIISTNECPELKPPNHNIVSFIQYMRVVKIMHFHILKCKEIIFQVPREKIID